jgi:hypothetical protein
MYFSKIDLYTCHLPYNFSEMRTAENYIFLWNGDWRASVEFIISFDEPGATCNLSLTTAIQPLSLF